MVKWYVTHTPQKFCVLYISNAVSQTQRSMYPIEQQHKKYLQYVKAVSQMNVYNFSLM